MTYPEAKQSLRSGIGMIAEAVGWMILISLRAGIEKFRAFFSSLRQFAIEAWETVTR